MSKAKTDFFCFVSADLTSVSICRVSLLVRVFAVFVSYPFVVIYSVLDLDKIVAEVSRGDRKVDNHRKLSISILSNIN